MEEDPAEKRRRLHRECQQRFRARQSQETLDRLNREAAQRMALAQANETPEQGQARRAGNTLSQANRRDVETLQQTQARRDADALMLSVFH